MAATITETTQYLTFKLGDEVFALDITKVREVLDFTTVTKVPRTPEFMRGVINLRGSVVPVVDLRLKFGMTRTENSVNTCIIITEVTVDGDTTILGCLADSVQEVLDLDARSTSRRRPGSGRSSGPTSSRGWGSGTTGSSSSWTSTRCSRMTSWHW